MDKTIKQEDIAIVRDAYESALDDSTYLNREEAACNNAWGAALTIVMNRYNIIKASDMTSEMLDEVMHLQMLAVDE